MDLYINTTLATFEVFLARTPPSLMVVSHSTSKKTISKRLLPPMETTATLIDVGSKATDTSYSVKK